VGYPGRPGCSIGFESLNSVLVSLAFFGLFFCLCFLYSYLRYLAIRIRIPYIALISLFAGKARRKVILFILQWTGASIVSDLTRTTRTTNFI
jgi:predicted membrane-bound mannosyltransferase